MSALSYLRWQTREARVNPLFVLVHNCLCTGTNRCVILSATVRGVFHFREVDISHLEVGSHIAGLPGFPEHDPDFPDVDPRTGDERETSDVS